MLSALGSVPLNIIGLQVSGGGLRCQKYPPVWEEVLGSSVAGVSAVGPVGDFRVQIPPLEVPLSTQGLVLSGIPGHQVVFCGRISVVVSSVVRRILWCGSKDFETRGLHSSYLPMFLQVLKRFG